jgi:hypothetical protein
VKQDWQEFRLAQRIVEVVTALGGQLHYETGALKITIARGSGN